MIPAVLFAVVALCIEKIVPTGFTLDLVIPFAVLFSLASPYAILIGIIWATTMGGGYEAWLLAMPATLLARPLYKLLRRVVTKPLPAIIVLFNLWHAYLFRSSLQILISNVVASFLVCYVILRQLEKSARIPPRYVDSSVICNLALKEAVSIGYKKLL